MFWQGSQYASAKMDQFSVHVIVASKRKTVFLSIEGVLKQIFFYNPCFIDIAMHICPKLIQE